MTRFLARQGAGSKHGLIHVVVHQAALMRFVATAAALRAHGADFFAAAAVTAAVVVVLLLAFMLYGLTPYALGFAVAATGRVVKKEHMFSPPLFYVRKRAEVFTLSFYAGSCKDVQKGVAAAHSYLT